MRLFTGAPAGSGLRSGVGGDQEAEEEEDEVPTEGDTASETQLHSLANLLACKHGLRVLRLLKAASEEAGSLTPV